MGPAVRRAILLSLLFLLFLSGAAFAERLTLEQCLEMARDMNLNLKRGESDLKITSLYETKARYNFYPSINSSAKFNTKTYSTSRTLNIHEYYFELIQPIYHFGEFTYKLDISKAIRIASLLQLMETNIQVERDVIVTYLTILKLKKLKAHIQNMISKARHQYEVVSALVRIGLKEPKSEERWRVLIDGYQDDLVKNENSLADAYTGLRKLLQYKNINEELQVVPVEVSEEFEYDYRQLQEIEKATGVVGIEKALYGYAKVFCPAIRKRVYDIKAAESSVAYERAVTMPKLDLAPRYQREEDTPYTFWTLGVRASFNFLDLPGWENVAIRQEELNRTRIDYDLFVRDRFSEIRTTFFNYLASVRKHPITIRQVDEATKYLINMHNTYANGKISDVELIDAFNSYYNSNTTRIQVLYDFFTSRAQLYSLIGHSTALQTPTVEEFMKKKDIEKYYSEKDIFYDYFYMKDMRAALDSGDIKKVEELRDKYRGIIGQKAFLQWRILHFAAFVGNKEILEKRIAQGKDVNVVALNGLTPLHLAAMQGHTEIVETLLKHGANPNFKAEMEEFTPLMAASERGFTEICDLLLKGGARVNERSKQGRTALHNAAEAGFLPVVKLLVETGADVTIKSDSGKTAAEMARFEGYNNVADYLESVTPGKGK
ncbi:MAG: ankyrin repeat domain-containing protein [Candidatus Eremiobacteraeota bacterium]|nr:ankyrin repeat domain-containing protein [Candidatus Eremiobacteraeota bacterium]